MDLTPAQQMRMLIAIERVKTGTATPNDKFIAELYESMTSVRTTATIMPNSPAMKEAQFHLSAFKEGLATWKADERLEYLMDETARIERQLNRLVPHSKRLDAWTAIHDVYSRYLVRVQKKPNLLTEKALLNVTNLHPRRPKPPRLL